MRLSVLIFTGIIYSVTVNENVNLSDNSWPHTSATSINLLKREMIGLDKGHVTRVVNAIFSFLLLLTFSEII